MRIKNFLFHRVSSQEDIMWPPMLPDHFEKTIKFLSKNYQIVLLENFLDKPERNTANKPIATVLFDDGYKDNLEFAAPILQKYKCPASFYIVTQCIDENIPTWTYSIDYFFKTHYKKSLTLSYDFVPQEFQIINWQTEDQSWVLSRKFKSWLKSLSNDHRLTIMNEVKNQSGNNVFPNGLMMNWNEVRQLKQAGFYVGSHSHTHPMLASLTDEKEIEKELKNSADIINQQLGYYPKTISYPIGSWDERVVKIAKKTGYKIGLIVGQKFYNSQNDDMMTIPRVELYNEPWWKTRLKINGLYQTARKIIK